MKKPKHDLTHVRHDPAHCLAPGLFRSLKRGDRKRCKLDVTYTFGEDESMRFVGFEPLGADDMRLLQGIVALGGPNGILLTPEPTSETGRQLRLFLEPRFEAIEQDGLVVRESLTKLLSETGMTDSGDNIKALKASLLRMSNVTILVIHCRGEGGDQEQKLADKYRVWADALQFTHPFVSSSLLMSMVNTYEREAEQNEAEACIQRRLKH